MKERAKHRRLQEEDLGYPKYTVYRSGSRIQSKIGKYGDLERKERSNRDLR